MRRKISEFNPGAVHHIYQRAIDHGVIFYTVEDRLVYYTVASVKARRHRVTVYAASLMFTHIHQSVRAESLFELRGYLHDLDTSFSRLYNYRHSRTGRLFEKPPGMSRKSGRKEIVSNLVYVFNNHVEKRLCSRAVQERWSLLAYAFSDHPFSRPLDMRSASRQLRRAVNLVNRRVRSCKCLEYRDLDRILPFLDKDEYEQFVDYVISKYAWIEFQSAAAYFGSPESMVTAVDSTTGGEYSIREEYSRYSDIAYMELVDFTVGSGMKMDLFRLTAEERNDLGYMAMKRTSAALYHVRKFFHI